MIKIASLYISGTIGLTTAMASAPIFVDCFDEDKCRAAEVYNVAYNRWDWYNCTSINCASGDPDPSCDADEKCWVRVSQVDPYNWSSYCECGTDGPYPCCSIKIYSTNNIPQPKLHGTDCDGVDEASGDYDDCGTGGACQIVTLTSGRKQAQCVVPTPPGG